MKVYQAIARTLQAIANCQEPGFAGWKTRYQSDLDKLIDNLPSESTTAHSSVGRIKTKLDDSSNSNKIVLNVEFHHMNDGGCYDVWTSHKVILTPDLAFGFNLRITGRDRNQIKDYLADTYHAALSATLNEMNVPVVCFIE